MYNCTATVQIAQMCIFELQVISSCSFFFFHSINPIAFVQRGMTKGNRLYIIIEILQRYSGGTRDGCTFSQAYSPGLRFLSTKQPLRYAEVCI